MTNDFMYPAELTSLQEKSSAEARIRDLTAEQEQSEKTLNDLITSLKGGQANSQHEGKEAADKVEAAHKADLPQEVSPAA